MIYTGCWTPFPFCHWGCPNSPQVPSLIPDCPPTLTLSAFFMAFLSMPLGTALAGAFL